MRTWLIQNGIMVGVTLLATISGFFTGVLWLLFLVYAVMLGVCFWIIKQEDINFGELNFKPLKGPFNKRVDMVFDVCYMFLLFFGIGWFTALWYAGMMLAQNHLIHAWNARVEQDTRD